MIRQFYPVDDDKPVARDGENCRIMLSTQYIMIF